MNKARAMLDALMGPGRDELPKDEEQEKNKFKDKSVCKGFLIGFCPLDTSVLGGKRTFTGGCPKIHSEIMRQQFLAHPDCETLRREYEAISIRDLEYVLRKCEDHKTEERNRIRTDVRRKKPPLPLHINDRLSAMKREATNLQAKVETMDDDQTREKEGMTAKALELLKDREDMLEVETKKAAEALDPELVCEICGTAYIGKDGEAAHLKFRIHSAYEQVRERLAELKPRVEEYEKERRDKKDEESKKRRKEEFEKAEKNGKKKRSRSKSGDKEKDKDKDGDKDDKEKDEKDKDEKDKDEKDKDEKDKGKERSRKRSRKRSRSRGEKDRSRKRSRSRGKERDRSAKKRRRSPSRSRRQAKSRSPSRRRDRRGGGGRSRDRSGGRSRKDRKDSRSPPRRRR